MYVVAKEVKPKMFLFSSFQGVQNMSPSSPLDKWRFLVGEWKGKSKDEFGEKGVTESIAVFSMEPRERFIMVVGEAWNAGRLANKSISLLFYDNNEQKFKRKSFFSYGFVNNEVEYAGNANEIKFDIKIEPLPKQLKGIRWRSSIRKISENKIAMGLEMAKGEEEFKRYGETVLVKTS
jgi:hypothetical protein